MSGIINIDTVSALAAAVAVLLVCRRDPARALMASGISIALSAAAWFRRQGDGRGQ